MGSRRAARSIAAALAAIMLGVLAPDNTTGRNGCAITQASDSASTLVDAVRAARLSVASLLANSGLLLRGVRRPLAIASLISTLIPASWAALSAGPTLCSSKFHVACTQSKSSCPSDVFTCMAFASVAACPVPDSVRPTRQPRSCFSLSSLANTSAFSRTPESSVAEWIWYSARYCPSRAADSSAWCSRCASVCSFTSCGVPPVSTCQSAV
mmetsp:Transcript_32641/g.83390  ORF Transcript_32641/g.83390 Transcript_32641/m.83390 type:complete len:211 (-) Transcript_32641:136-768(-)